TFNDIAPAHLFFGAAEAGNLSNHLPGAPATNLPACAGETLLATGPPGDPGGGDHNPLLPAPR
ncbi:MAG: hypothetical protein WA459_05110, partial [Stellaceae bacterium]